MAKQTEAQARNYQENKELFRERQRMTKKYKQDYLQAIKLEKGCQICGYDKCPRALVLHHIDESLKTDEPTKMFQNKWSFKRIDEELKNCMVLCHNCHVEHHAGYVNADLYIIPLEEYVTYRTWDKNRRFTKKEVLKEAPVAQQDRVSDF